MRRGDRSCRAILGEKNMSNDQHVITRHPIADVIARHGTLVIDGAMSTALEALGADLNDTLWSAKVLYEAPELIERVHYDYFKAGANAAITASYQATEAGFATKGFAAARAAELVELSVELAKRAREKVLAEDASLLKDDLLIAGAIGPYGAYLADGSEYTGRYQLTKDEFVAFHKLRLESLIKAGADLLAIETQPRMDEIETLLSMLEGRDVVCWVTMTLADEGHLPDGTTLEEAARRLDANPHVEAFGLNCIKRELAEPALARLASQSKKPLIVYPNSGETYDPATKTWHHPVAGGHDWSHFVPRWQGAGARCIGGCCRTLPRDIIEIARLLKASGK